MDHAYLILVVLLYFATNVAIEDLFSDIDAERHYSKATPLRVRWSERSPRLNLFFLLFTLPAIVIVICIIFLVESKESFSSMIGNREISV